MIELQKALQCCQKALYLAYSGCMFSISLLCVLETNFDKKFNLLFNFTLNYNIRNGRQSNDRKNEFPPKQFDIGQLLRLKLAAKYYSNYPLLHISAKISQLCNWTSVFLCYLNDHRLWLTSS